MSVRIFRMSCMNVQTKSALEMYNCTMSGHKVLNEYYCWRHLWACADADITPVSKQINQLNLADVGQWFCENYIDSEKARYICNLVFILWVLKLHRCNPDIIRKIVDTINRSGRIDSIKLTQTARILYQKAISSNNQEDGVIFAH